MLRGRGGSERGSVAITVTLALTVLLGFAALVVDVGLNWAARASAQTAADSAALAGATRLLADGPAGAVTAVRDYLDFNVPGLAGTNPAWVDDGDESNGEVVCWTLPAPPPDPPPGGAANCPPGSNALQVITPPIEVNYAFAPVLGKRSNEIKALAAAGAGPAAPNNCVLCVLEPTDAAALNVLGLGGEVEVEGGGIAVNSSNLAALVLSAGGDVRADQIRVVGGFRDTGLGDFLPDPEPGGPPVTDPLADLPTPDELVPAPAPQVPPPLAGTVILPPGVYPSITVDAGVTVTLQEGVYVFTEAAGLTIRDGGRVVGDGATVYLACEAYPTRCSGNGAGFLLEAGGQFQVSPPASGEYAGLSIFADRGNTTPMRLRDQVSLDGAVYGASTSLRLRSPGAVEIGSLLVVDTLRVNDTDLAVDYDPSTPLPGIGRPVLIR